MFGKVRSFTLGYHPLGWSSPDAVVYMLFVIQHFYATIGFSLPVGEPDVD